MTLGISRHDGRTHLPRHRHQNGYIALVLRGSYVEAGDQGRLCAKPGRAIVHGAYAAHRDDFTGSGAEVLNLPLLPELDECVGFVRDVDIVARLAARDLVAAAHEAMRQFERGSDLFDDWPDLLAMQLRTGQPLDLAAWARNMGIAPQSLSRGFRRAYGVSPKRYRLEQRARRAAAQVPVWNGTLAALAADQGFADQAHMARAIGAIALASPRQLRVQSVQA